MRGQREAEGGKILGGAGQGSSRRRGLGRVGWGGDSGFRDFSDERRGLEKGDRRGSLALPGSDEDGAAVATGSVG